jgi:hypothetical protein
MKQTIAILAPFIAALAGAGLWVLISVLWRWEIGLLALGIGAFVGAATRWGIPTSRQLPNRTVIFKGLLGAALTLLAIGGGKLGAAWLELEWEYRDYLSQVEQAGSMIATAETAMVHLALDLVEAKEAAGETLAWPAGKDSDSAFEPSDFPPEIWAETLQDWEGMPELDKLRHIEVAQAALTAFSKAERQAWGVLDLWGVIQLNMDLFDLVFTLLASVAAYHIATARSGNAAVSRPEGA